MKVKETFVYQDNMSLMLLEKNGRSSSSKRTRHMNIRFFFVKDQVASKEIRIEYCPTKEMVADFFTKPLQGSQFYKLRDQKNGGYGAGNSQTNVCSVRDYGAQ